MATSATIRIISLVAFETQSDSWIHTDQYGMNLQLSSCVGILHPFSFTCTDVLYSFLIKMEYCFLC